MPRQPLHVLVGGFIRKPGFVRMNAQRRVNEIVLLRQTNSAIHLRRTVAVADGDDGLHPSLASPRNHLLAVGVELLAVKMRMRINKHWYGWVGTGTLARPCRAKLGSVLTSSP